MTERVLNWDRAITPQETGWWCGPAATQVVLNSRGIKVAEAELAREIGTHVGGTDHIGWITDRSLRHRVPEAGYVGVNLPNDPPNAAQRATLWEHIVRSIDAGYGLVVNWVVPVSNRPIGIKGSQTLQYPSGGTSYHYVAYMGYDSAGDRAVFVADSGFRPFESWISFNQACTLIPPKAYAWASKAAPVVIPPPMAGDPLDTLIAAMAPSTVSRDRFNELLPGVVQALNECRCDNTNRIAMWMGQIGHESGGLRYMEEIADGSAYEGRQDLGNTQPGDGRRFKGRGPIQITGRHNYTQVSRWAFSQGYVDSPTFFVDNPTEMASPRYGFMGTVWYWTVARPNINSMSDARDILGVTKAINGGTHGLQDRTNRWNNATRMGDRLFDLTQAKEEEDFMPALTPDEQREVLERLRILTDERYMSISPFRHLDEQGNKNAAVTTAGRVNFIDANSHVMFVMMLANLGDHGQLSLLREVASAAGDPRYPERQADAKFAQFVLDRLAETGQPEVEPEEPPPPPPFVCAITGGPTCVIGGEKECSETRSGVCIRTEYGQIAAG